MPKLKRWRSHKVVEAGKILSISTLGGTTTLRVEGDSGPVVIPVSAEFMAKHAPQDGGYFVVYEDGYRSFSPPEAFEQGYTQYVPSPAA